MSPKLRVLVVDDSAFARKVVREVLAAEPGLEVVGFARDGLEALERVAELAPDVVTLDLMMPALDGLGFLRALPRGEGPRVVVVSVSDEQSEVVVEALSIGAFDFVRKPTSLATDRLYELGAELVRKVRAAGESRGGGRDAQAARGSSAPVAAPSPAPASGVRCVVIGTSTGGPAALTRVLPMLPAAFPVPVLVALHIPSEYTHAMAERLDAESRIRVVEAHDGLALAPGVAVIARGGADLEVEAGAVGAAVRVTLDARRVYHPSVDVLFESAARAFGPGVLGVVLTGMGDDGLLGARAIRAAGGRLLVEAERTSIVYGMPRTVWEAGLADEELALEDVAAEVARRVTAR